MVDFQPLHPTPEYSAKYIAPLSPIRNRYPDLHGQLSGKIYDDTSFFSKNMLFGRFTDETKLKGVVMPAHAEYLKAYINTVSQTVADTSAEATEVVRARQSAYDTYSALKDPAVGLFDAYFGKEWSHDFVHKFLFEMADSDNSQKNGPIHTFRVDNATGRPIISS